MMNPKTHARIHPSCRLGFTLVELLVVITIIIVMAAIVFPVARNMRATAKNTECVSRLRSWSVVMGAFAAENDGKIAWKNWAPIGWDPAKSSPYIPYWTTGSVDLAAQEDGGGHKIQLQMRHCPTVPSPQTPGVNPSVNYAMIRPTAATGIVSAATYPLASITNGARFIIMTEALENSGGPIASGGDFTSQVKPLTLNGNKLRHKHKVNVLMGDFSVRAMTWKDIEKGLTYWTAL